MLLSHGLTDNGLCWGRAAKALETDYDIVMLDARGHGESARLHDGETHAPGQDIAEAIECLKLTSPIVIGHSVGALAVAAFANAHPHKAFKVILEDPPFLPMTKPSAALDRQKKFRQQVAEFHAMSEAEITDMGKNLSPDWHNDEFPAWTLGKRQVGPAAMPREVVDRLNREIVGVLKMPEVRQQIAGIGAETIASTAAEFAAVMKADADRLGRLIRERNIRAN